MLNNLIENIRRYGLEKVFQRYYSIYRAEVVKNNDEEKRGRITVKVPSLFADSELSAWAEPRDYRGSGKGYGEFMPPNIGDFVFVEFEGGDTRFPLYSGGWFAEGELGEDFKYDPENAKKDDANGPIVRGFTTVSGHKILFDETKGKNKLSVVLAKGVKGKKSHQLDFDMTEGKEQLSLKTAGGHFLALDDTSGKEGVYLIHKGGSQLQIDSKNTAKIFTSKGNFLNLSGEDGVATVASGKGALVTLDDAVVLSESKGKSLITINSDGVTITTDKDIVAQCNSLTATAGAITLDGGKAKMTLGSGKVALGSPVCEVVQSMIGIIDALLDDPALVQTGVGPSSGLLGVAKIQLTLIKVKLTLIKGTL